MLSNPSAIFLPTNVEMVFGDIELIEPEKNRIKLSDGKMINYDYMVVSTGSEIRPDETPGMLDGWHKNIFDFYTPKGAEKLHQFLEIWQGGRLVLNVAEMPIKCPVAPLEFIMLADWYFRKRGIRNKVELIYATPLTGAFTKPICSIMLADVLKDKNITHCPRIQHHGSGQ